MTTARCVRGYTNSLHVLHGGKGVPYRSDGVLRDDGDANHGFINLKGHPERLADVPELARDEALRVCVALLNEPDSAFGTVGCVSARVDEPEGHRVTGYVEFAFDSAEMIADAANYFPAFFHFDAALHRARFDDGIHFHWELMGATFHRTGSIGFTMTVTINTDWCETAERASLAWASGLGLLAGFLRNVRTDAATRIFVDG